MADLEALEAAIEEEDDTIATSGTRGAPLELVRRVRLLEEAFKAGKLKGAPTTAYEIFKSEAKRETSVLVNRGLRLRKLAGKDELYFHCVCNGCWIGAWDDDGIEGSRNKLKYSARATSNATAHLKGIHGVESTKSKTGKSKVSLASDAVDRTAAAWQRDPVAFAQNALTLWATYHSIPISAFMSPVFQQILERLPGCGRGTMERTLCRKLLLQQYLTVKARVQREIAVAKGYFGQMPFVCVNLDLYQDPRQNKKYMAVRVSWVDAVAGRLVSRLIAARLYNPSYQEKQSTKATALLAKWYRSVTAEYRVTDQMVLGGTGDHGSDVKKVMREYCGESGFQEWCISHMLGCCFNDAFGLAHDRVRMCMSLPSSLASVSRFRLSPSFDSYRSTSRTHRRGRLSIRSASLSSR
jgi:hypothetical protein